MLLNTRVHVGKEVGCFVIACDSSDRPFFFRFVDIVFVQNSLEGPLFPISCRLLHRIFTYTNYLIKSDILVNLSKTMIHKL